MALLLRDREPGPAAATPSPNGDPYATVPDYACEACGAGMQRGQDWCLECGSAARGRIGGRPGWLAAATVVGVTLLLVFGAGIAGYAALTSDAERTAAAPTAGNGNPVIAQTPAAGAPTSPGVNPELINPGVTGPGVTPPPAPTGPVVTQKLPPGTLPGGVQTAPRPGVNLPVIPPTKPVTPAVTQKLPQTVPSPTNSTSAPSTTAPSTATATSAAIAPQIINVKADAAQTYDPTKRAGAEVGPAKNAVDGKKNTVWDVTVPADGNPIAVGLLVDLGTPYALKSLRIATDTPGFRAEIYGAVDAKELPADVLDKRWQHLTDVKSVQDDAPILLRGKGDAPKYQLFLVYVTIPGEPTDPRAAIGELTLRGTP